MPTNKYLLDEKVDKESNKTKEALERWGRLHAVRSVIGLVSTIVLLYRS